MSEEKVPGEVKSRSVDGRLPCHVAFEIAAELGVEPIAIGRAANELGVKIINCQLGCFGDKKAKPKT